MTIFFFDFFFLLSVNIYVTSVGHVQYYVRTKWLTDWSVTTDNRLALSSPTELRKNRKNLRFAYVRYRTVQKMVICMIPPFTSQLMWMIIGVANTK